ncbi:MAG: hypothetical protein WC227_01990 [Patescibacteria group bacterium]|jgi:hypothetical protein
MTEAKVQEKVGGLKDELTDVVRDEQSKEKAMMLLDYKIKTIHDSTRTDFSPMAKVHNNLRMRFPWYYNWHISPWSSVTHRLILLLLIIAIIFLFYITKSGN